MMQYLLLVCQSTHRGTLAERGHGLAHPETQSVRGWMHFVVLVVRGVSPPVVKVVSRACKTCGGDELRRSGRLVSKRGSCFWLIPAGWLFDRPELAWTSRARFAYAVDPGLSRPILLVSA